MGHFGRTPLRLDWMVFVLPALALNYFGQGALVLADPAAAANPFFLMFPAWSIYGVVALATAATVIASQALISGAFTLSQQATLLGLLPRLQIRQTSDEEIGQVYVPQINWLLAIGVVALVLGFRSSEALANAYGIAVVSTMVATTILAGTVARHNWRWGWPAVAAVTAAFLVVDLAFLAANAAKVLKGGWFPLLAGALIFALMMTWRRGRRAVIAALGEDRADLQDFLRKLDPARYPRTSGTAIYMTARSDTVPAALALNLRHNGVLHERIALLAVVIARVPFVDADRRVEAHELGKGFWAVTIRFGFFEKPDVAAALAADPADFPIDLATTSFFLGRELPVPTVNPRLNVWQAPLYAFLTRNAVSAPEYYLIPTENVVELGTRVEL